LRISARRRFKKRAQILHQTCVRLAHRLAAAARPAHALPINLLAAAQLAQRPPDRAARKPRGPRNGGDPAASRTQRFCRRKPSPTALVEHRIERRKPQANGRFINHASML
jgi:hypothetical protein